MNKLELIKCLKDLREKMGFSQEYLAHKLGMLRQTYIQVEHGSRELTVSEAQNAAAIFGVSLSEFLENCPKPVSVTIENETASGKTEKKNELRINLPQKNLKKFKEVLLYLLQKVGAAPHVGETVIYKLLYFIDFDYYEIYEEQLIGATYIKNHFGPTPVEFKKVVENMVKRHEIDIVKSKYFQHEQKKYLPVRTPDLSVLTAREIKHIDEVVERLGNKNATALSEYSHDDVPWITANEMEKLEYEAVFYRTPKTSVRNYANSV
jgi:transcriptional regulator with XRE-family HTH domain